MATYGIWLQTPTGEALDNIDDFLSLSYTRTINDIGSLELVLNGDYPTSYLKTDGRIYVYRDGRLENDGPWFIRKTIKSIPRSGAKTITVYAQSANQILNTRIAAYASGASQVDVSDYADNLMKFIVRTNLGSSASDSNRNLSSYLSIESDASYGAIIDKSFSRDNGLEILQEISQSSITAGSAVYFDVVATTTSGLEFRTYRELRGIDHTFPNGINPVVLSPERGNLVDVELTFDRSEEITYVYAGGTGRQEERLIATASSLARINESPFNRREYFLSYGNISSSTALQDEAEATLRAGRPRRSFSGTLVNVPNSCEYGVHWNLGDMVTAEAEGESYDCLIDSVTVTVQGNEDINGNLRVEED